METVDYEIQTLEAIVAWYDRTLKFLEDSMKEITDPVASAYLDMNHKKREIEATLHSLYAERDRSVQNYSTEPFA